MANKYLALQGEKFDISKVTVVGSPTITSDGVASGFTTNNYLSISPIIQLGNYDNWELVSPKFTTSNTIGGVSQAVFWATYNTWTGGIRIGITSNGKLYTQLASQANTDRDILLFDSVNAMPNTTYQMKIKFTGSQYIVWYKVNNADWIEYGSVETSIKVYNTWTEMFIGNISNWSFLGSIDLKEFKIHADGQLVYTPTKPTYLLERRKPKVWNKGQFTVVGNPSISDDGIASGFSNGHLSIPYILKSPTNFSIQGDFTFGDDVSSTNQQMLFGIKRNGTNTFLMEMRTISGNSAAFIYSNGASSHAILYFSQTELPRISGANYQYKVEVQGTNLSLTMNNITKTATDFYTDISTAFYLGTDRNGYDYGFKGSIDLKQFKIYTDNNLVFDGGADTYVYDASKFTVVGSLTITEYGVASNGTGSNYVFKKFTEPLSNFTIIIPLTLKKPYSEDTGAKFAFYSKRPELTELLAGFNFRYEGQNNNLVFTWVNRISVDLYENIFPYTTLINGAYNTKYYVKISKNNDEYSVSYSVDNINYSTPLTRTYTNNENPFVLDTLELLRDSRSAIEVDLKDVSITVDGKEVFTGAKENYYMLRR